MPAHTAEVSTVADMLATLSVELCRRPAGVETLVAAGGLDDVMTLLGLLPMPGSEPWRHRYARAALWPTLLHSRP